MTESWRWHGGGIEAARAHFGDSDQPWLDLSTGINPTPWPGAGQIAIDWQRLPEERDLRDLEAAAAAHFDCDPAHVCALPGTEIGLRLIGELIPGPARFAAPSYRTHGDMFGGAKPGALDDADRGGTLILANPNNPTGHVTIRHKLLDWPDWLIVDEAFADCDQTHSVAGDVADDRRLVVFRSFGKFFGLAGLRLGFVLAPRPIIAGFRALMGAWPVSAAAIAIGAAAYRDKAWIDAARRKLSHDAKALDVVLAKHGHQPKGECPLFRLIQTTEVSHLFNNLAHESILTRPFDYAPDWLRLGLPGTPAALDRLDRALSHG